MFRKYSRRADLRFAAPDDGAAGGGVRPGRRDRGVGRKPAGAAGKAHQRRSGAADGVARSLRRKRRVQGAGRGGGGALVSRCGGADSLAGRRARLRDVPAAEGRRARRSHRGKACRRRLQLPRKTA